MKTRMQELKQAYTHYRRARSINQHVTRERQRIAEEEAKATLELARIIEDVVLKVNEKP